MTSKKLSYRSDHKHYFGNRLFKRKLKKKWRWKRFPQFLLCMCVVFLFVCLSVVAPQTSNIGGWHFDIDTNMWISQNGVFYFCHFFGVIPLFRFLPFPLFHACESTYHDNQYIKLKLRTRGIYYVYWYWHFIVMTSPYDVMNFENITNASYLTFWVLIR